MAVDDATSQMTEISYSLSLASAIYVCLSSLGSIALNPFNVSIWWITNDLHRIFIRSYANSTGVVNSPYEVSVCATSASKRAGYDKRRLLLTYTNSDCSSIETSEVGPKMTMITRNWLPNWKQRCFIISIDISINRQPGIGALVTFIAYFSL